MKFLKGTEQSTQVTTDTKNTQKRVGTGWDGRWSTQELESRTRVDNHRANKARKQAQGNKWWRRIGQTIRKLWEGKRQEGGPGGINGGMEKENKSDRQEVSVGLIRPRETPRRKGEVSGAGDRLISGISVRRVVEGRSDKTAVKVGRRARWRHTVMRLVITLA
ncbi:hypothetical protein BY996DRAFT_6558336 [Phakopsora pachyrhizi]|nr:hypothetical protein BY996DRAFT_6558336 [Phakopsora pachyrhizi]